MIVDILVGGVLGILRWAGGFLPQSSLTLPTPVGLVGFIDDLNYFLPIAEVMVTVVAVIALGPAFLVSTITLWIAVSVFRGGSARA